MISVEKQARKLLAGVRAGTTDQKIFIGYLSFEEGAQPSWWSPEEARRGWGRVLGVHEDMPNVRDGAFVVTELGLGVLHDRAGATWLPYEEIAGWEKLSKDPVSRSLFVNTSDGDRVELRFSRGGAFAVVQFLSQAIRARKKV